MLGRFVQPDTIVPEPGNPQDLNRFSYCRNRPLYYIDPTGHAWWIPVGFAVGAVVGAGIGYGAQVIANRSRGMDWGQALTTDIDPGKVVQGAFAGAIAGTLVATGVGLVATGPTAAGAGTAGNVATGVATAVVADDGGAAELNAAQTAVRQVAAGVQSAGSRGSALGSQALLTPTTWQEAERQLSAHLGVARNTLNQFVQGMGQARRPDFISIEGQYIAECKWRIDLYLSSQLRDMIALAEQGNMAFRLYVRMATVVPEPLLKAVQATGGDVIRIFE